MRTAIFVGLHKDDLRRELFAGKVVSETGLIEPLVVKRKFYMHGMRLAAFIAINIYIIDRHGLSLRFRREYVRSVRGSNFRRRLLQAFTNLSWNSKLFCKKV